MTRPFSISIALWICSRISRKPIACAAAPMWRSRIRTRRSAISRGSLELLPRDTLALVERGFARLDKKDYASAIADAARAIALDPKLARAYNLRGTARRAAGDPRKAIEDFSKAVEFEPNLDNYFQRASTYQSIGDHARAIADFDKAIEEDPMQPHIHYARAESRAAVGDRAGAEADIAIGHKIDGY